MANKKSRWLLVWQEVGQWPVPVLNVHACPVCACKEGVCKEGVCKEGVCKEGVCRRVCARRVCARCVQGGCVQGGCVQGGCVQGGCVQGECARRVCARRVCARRVCAWGVCGMIMNHGEEVPTFWFRRVIIRVELLVHINGIVYLMEVKGHSVTFSGGQRSFGILAILCAYGIWTTAMHILLYLHV